MPNFDGTGPAGNGPKTGQGRGSCDNSQQSAGQGRGIKKGCCPRNALFQNANNCISLDEQEKILENRLAAIKKAKQESNS